MRENINKVFGKKILSLRKELNISQEELSLRSDLSRTYISSIERGEKSPTLNAIEKLAIALNVKIYTFFKED